MYNTILTDTHRRLYEEEDKFLSKLAPEVHSRKFPQANVQQAFTFSLVTDFSEAKSTSILCAGCHEDTTFEVLRKLNYSVIGVDPAINYPLEHFVSIFPSARFDIVFSTSVLEHVPDDENFVKLLAQVTETGGRGILTFDYNNNYRQGSPKPVEDVRLYTSKDLRTRIVPVLESCGCTLLDEPAWGESANEFSYGGAYYSFATLVYKKVG